jgi:hypothetical protein
MCDLVADRIRLAGAGQGWFIALQGSSSSIRRDVYLREAIGGAGINPAREIR